MDLGETRKKLCCVPSERQCSVVKNSESQLLYPCSWIFVW